MEVEALELLRRNSGLRVDGEGVFWNRASPVANSRVQALFHRGLDVRADGEVVLTVGPRWCYVECEVVARFVVALLPRDEGLICRLVSGDKRGDLIAIGYGPDDRFYFWFDGLRGPARALRGAHHSLLALLQEQGRVEAPHATVVYNGTTAMDVAVLSGVPAPGQALFHL